MANKISAPPRGEIERLRRGGFMFTSRMIQAAIFRIGILTDRLNRALDRSFVWIYAVPHTQDNANALPHQVTGHCFSLSRIYRYWARMPR